MSVPQALARLLGPGEQEIGCDDCFAALDRCVELELAGADLEEVLPGFSTHLAGCPACQEDYESLTAFVSREQAS
jgi:hypothetical protein